MTDLPAELANLPAPSLVEELSYEARLALFQARLAAAFAAAGIDYDVTDLETDPAQILLQVAAYQDVLLRQRVNEAVRGTLLPYATGPDLDILAQFYDVSRQSGEADKRLRERVVLAIRGRSTGGTEPRYRAIAMGADLRVADASVYTEGRDPTVKIAIYSTENAGLASASLIQAVQAAIDAPSARMVNDRVVVLAAVRQVVNVAAKVWLLPETSAAITDAMASALRAAWEREIVLGRDVTLSWLISRLMIDGVQRVEVEAPLTDIVMPPYQAAALGSISLAVAGRDY